MSIFNNQKAILVFKSTFDFYDPGYESSYSSASYQSLQLIKSRLLTSDHVYLNDKHMSMLNDDDFEYLKDKMEKDSYDKLINLHLSKEIKL